jgi:solute:Na+ symporter, SSS family
MIASFGILNTFVLATYFSSMILIGLWFARRQQTTEDYFLARRAMPWLPVAMSMFASLTSAITFMGLPARAYEENISLILVCIVSPLLVPVLTCVLYPAYRRHNVTTSYEFIGLRFGRPGRTAVSILFVLARLGWMGTVIYAPALALSTATGISLWMAILLMGTLATLYTALGGLAAVLWTDVVQFLILVLGAIWVATSLVTDTPGGFEGIWHTAREAGRLDIGGWRLNWREMSGLAVLVSFFLKMLQEYGTDQVGVQRMLAIRKPNGVIKAATFNAAVDVIMIALLLFIGLGLLAYYQANPALAPTGKADSILPHFIVHALPAGVSGLLISAIFAAAMSSMDSGINSMATVITNDLIKPFRRQTVADATDVKLARLLTAAIGLVATLFAFGIGRMAHMVNAFATFMGMFSAPVLALFLLGFISKRTRFAAWCIGVIPAIIAVMAAKRADVHWVYLFPLSFFISFSVGFLLSLRKPKNRKSGLM